MRFPCVLCGASARRAGVAASAVVAAALPLFLAGALFLLLPINSSAQTATQQRVYGAASATATTAILPAYNKDSTTGTLGLLPGAPFADRLEGGFAAIDGQGKFLFVLNPVSDNISMYQIDGTTGALTEVPGSPFAAGPTVNPNMAPSSPISLATEKTGGFLYVGYANGDTSTTSAVVPFAIDAANLQLVLTPQLSLDLSTGAPVQMLADPKGLRLYVGLGPGGVQGGLSAGTLVYSIDSSSGILTATGNAGGGTDFGRSIAVDPQGRFFFDGWGQSEGFLDSGLISPVDGTSSVSSTLNLGLAVFPSVLMVDSSGKFLYVQTNAGLQIFSIDGTSGALTLLSAGLTQFTFSPGKVVADPMGPYLYSLGRAGVDAYQIDATTGNLTEIPNAPFSTGASGPAGSLGLAISGSPIQSVSGPAAQVFPASQDFGQIVVGQTSGTKMISLTNVGNQTLAISGISVTGNNAGDFAQSSTCGATLAANVSCTVSVLFTPSSASAEQATLQVSDNAPGSPQSAALTGTGVATQGALTLAPASLTFGTIAQGGNASQSVQLTNSGSGPLHVSSVALSGSNPADFSQTNTCAGNTLAVHASCTVNVTFAPQAQAQRTASLVITDDGAGSPQSMALSGGGASPFQLSASGSTSATVSAGQTAQYSLQVTPGPDFAGSITLSCAGAPSLATCSMTPSSLSITNASTTVFQVAVTTTASGLAPVSRLQPKPWLGLPVVAICVCGWFLFMIQRAVNTRKPRFLVPELAFCFSLGLIAIGCGSGSGGGSGSISNNATDPPVHAGTPPGTSTLTITAQSGKLPAQTLQLTLTVN